MSMIKNKIERHFPDQDHEMILAELTLTRDGLSSHRCVNVYDLILENSQGDLERLQRLVKWDLANRVSFDLFLKRWLMWIQISEQYLRETGPTYLSHASNVFFEIGRHASFHLCFPSTSHMTVCLSKHQGGIDQDLFIVPLLDQSFFISHDSGVILEPKMKEIANRFKGHVAETNVTKRCVEEIQSIFKIDEGWSE